MNIPDCYDPVFQAERLAAEQDAALEKYPVCAHCHRPIQTEYTCEINDELLHPDCAIEKYGRRTEDYILED